MAFIPGCKPVQRHNNSGTEEWHCDLSRIKGGRKIGIESPVVVLKELNGNLVVQDSGGASTDDVKDLLSYLKRYMR